MKTKKEINLGEYIIKISYNSSDGSLTVRVFDELDDEIERIEITADEDDIDEDDPFNGLLN